MSTKEILFKKFGHSSFRLGQEAILNSVLAAHDTLAVMPTGGGKSLCYQLPTLVFGSLCIVISPLIALMRDQVRQLRERGIPAGALHSGQCDSEKKQIFEEMKKGGSYLLFLSPERVQKPGFATWLQNQSVSLFAIDEAHCVSQWGPDFRPDYHKLSILRELKPETTILALTATATPQVLQDVASTLSLRNAKKFVYGFYRPNLFYKIMHCQREEEKLTHLKTVLQRIPEGIKLIYCGTRTQAETIANQLSFDFENVDFYHAGLSSEERNSVQRRMETGDVKILCATNAFGMGIDYPDVRLVVHYQMPANIESYYQEMGRAGRDGKDALCLLLFSPKDIGLQAFFIRSSKAPVRVIQQRWKALEAMTQFVEGGECRHSGVLTYFLDSQRIEACGHCDICCPKEWDFKPDPIVFSQSEKLIAKTKRRPKQASVIEPIMGPEAEVRAMVLKDWRKRFAKEKDLAAFVVFSNRTLADLANKNPGDLESLEKVYGFGPTKVSSLGPEILRILRECNQPS